MIAGSADSDDIAKNDIQQKKDDCLHRMLSAAAGSQTQTRMDLWALLVGFEMPLEMSCAAWRTEARRSNCWIACMAALVAFGSRGITLLLAGNGIVDTLVRCLLHMCSSLVLLMASMHVYNDKYFNLVLVVAVLGQSLYRAWAALDVAHTMYITAETDADEASHIIAFSMSLLLLPLMVKLFIDPPVSLSIVTILVPNGLFGYHAPLALNEVYTRPAIHVYTGLMCVGILFLEYNVRSKFLDTLKIIQLQQKVDGLQTNERELEGLLKHYRIFMDDPDDNSKSSSHALHA